jgi:hypothetical protein
MYLQSVLELRSLYRGNVLIGFMKLKSSMANDETLEFILTQELRVSKDANAIVSFAKKMEKLARG